MSEEPIRSMYQERPDYRVDPLVRTDVMSARYGDIRLAHSDARPIVDEQDHGLAVYFPRDAVDFSHPEPIGIRTVCPFKGQAVYWRPAAGGDRGIARSYPEPFPQVARPAGYIGFDQDQIRVTIGAGRYTGGRS
ncbi:DUF427 domain-containing protein [Nocardia brevicatena]|uniref:DUF427 domain-containing protein n=1 Tax=Nocardia brevicatena TaxID=37327 RepID=UPI000594891D|nr:DUF427 domain-containing protein [Nocardia brevicatena]